MKTIRVNKKLFAEIMASDRPDYVAYQAGVYNAVQHERTERKARSVYLIDTGSNLRDASCRIMCAK